MRSSNTIQVWEWDKLYYEDSTCFTQRHWEALCHYLQCINRSNGITPFQIIHKGIRFTSYVGIVQVGNLTIEILPKTDKAQLTNAASAATGKQLWQSALIQMLAACKWLPVHAGGYAMQQVKQQSLPDIYLSAFLTEVEKLLHVGLLKQYEAQEGNRMVLKGRLLPGQQATRNSVHRERFYISSTRYTADQRFNRILHQAVCLVRQVSVNVSLQSFASNLLLQFPAMQPAPVSKETFARLTYNRTTEHYRPAMQLAEMLLLHTIPGNTAGMVPALAILFDMNSLWEEWVYRQLKKEELTCCVTVQRQQGTPFWKGEHHLKHKTIRPDIIIKTADGETIIVDTKWKLPDNNIPDDDDLKQLFVYNLYWQCNQGILLYPAAENTAEEGSYFPLAQLGEKRLICRMLYQSIFKNGKIDPEFGKRILKEILSKEKAR